MAQEFLVCTHEESRSQNPHKRTVLPANPAPNRQRQEAPRAHWSAGLANLESSKFKERLCLKEQGRRQKDGMVFSIRMVPIGS